MLKGIDVSEHQGRIDWKRVKGQVDFVIIRAGYGHNNIDKQFIRNIQECNRLGIPCGVYWFSYAISVECARNEAKYVLAAIKNYKVDYPVSFDLEYDTLRYAKTKGVNITKRLATDMVKAFCDEINRNGYKAMNYTNQDFLLNKFYMNELTNYPVWYAWYNKELNKKYAIWQYSDKGRIDGINTNSVDMNYCYENFSELIVNNIFFEKKSDFIKLTNAKTMFALDPRDNPSSSYRDLGEIYEGERIRILPEVCDFREFLPATYWKDSENKESSSIWINANQDGLKIDTNATVINVLTELDARYEPTPNSKRMGYVRNGERLYVHRLEEDYALATYYAGSGYKTAWFTAKYVKID